MNQNVSRKNCGPGLTAEKRIFFGRGVCRHIRFNIFILFAFICAAVSADEKLGITWKERNTSAPGCEISYSKGETSSNETLPWLTMKTGGEYSGVLDVVSERIPVKGNASYRINISGVYDRNGAETGLWLFVHFFDKTGKKIEPPKQTFKSRFKIDSGMLIAYISLNGNLSPQDFNVSQDAVFIQFRLRMNCAKSRKTGAFINKPELFSLESK